jgi:hypothetical protein
MQPPDCGEQSYALTACVRRSRTGSHLMAKRGYHVTNKNINHPPQNRQPWSPWRAARRLELAHDLHPTVFCSAGFSLGASLSSRTELRKRRAKLLIMAMLGVFSIFLASARLGLDTYAGSRYPPGEVSPSGAQAIVVLPPYTLLLRRSPRLDSATSDVSIPRGFLRNGALCRY